MGESILIEALGVPVVLDTTGTTDAEASAVRAAWRDAVVSDRARSGSSAEEVVILVREAGDESDLPQLLERLSQRVTLVAITTQRGRLWMLHAAGLALPDGRVLVLVGPSGRGKTTASRVLGAQLGYVSDETVAIDRDGRVYPYRKPLSIIEGGAYPKAQRSPAELGLAGLPDAPLQLAAIVLLDRRPDAADEPVIETLDLGDALEELVSQTSFLPDLDRPLQQLAAHVSAVGGVRRVVYSEATALSRIVENLVASGAEMPWHPAADGMLSVPVPRASAGYARTPIIDAVALTDPDRIAILQTDAEGEGEGAVQMLAGIAPALWRAASGAPFGDLVDAAIDAYGAPDDGAAGAAVRGAVDELVAAGLVRETVEQAWCIRDDVAWLDSGDRIAVLSLAAPDAQTRILEGSAGLIWRALADDPSDGTAAVIVTRVADAAGIDADGISRDVEAFLIDLRDSGFVSER
ncbi:hypothetical protein BOH66_14040 [Microbacterium aurum]|uniref:Uncharacterized protein n=1 Tax=Microbacterium aurum TaxID=36805 RepID=A0A1P8UAT9_9MICO|nr:PqqD family peptide modification chaperone [Microbacterium aurum]APZ35241.1 hypothetical protein BOH66_14040 [Microbacterium aurum]MBM7829225.1 hypothetical protein [Microbacterium aurum]